MELGSKWNPQETEKSPGNERVRSFSRGTRKTTKFNSQRLLVEDSGDRSGGDVGMQLIRRREFDGYGEAHIPEQAVDSERSESGGSSRSSTSFGSHSTSSTLTSTNRGYWSAREEQEEKESEGKNATKWSLTASQYVS